MNNNTLQTTSREFGLEIEINTLTPTEAFNAMRQYGQTPSVTNPIDMTGMWRTNLNRTRMQCTSDCTVSAEIKTNPSNSLLPIADVMGALKMGGATIGRNCGQHVNIDARDLSFGDVKRLAKLWCVYERTIFQLVPTSRHNNNYCDFAFGSNENLNDKLVNIDNATNMRELHRCGSFNRSALNLMNAQTDTDSQRIEFRLHGGTLNVTKIGRFIKLMCEMVDASKRMDISADMVVTHDSGISVNDLTTNSIYSFAEMFQTIHAPSNVDSQTPTPSITMRQSNVVAHNRIDGIDIAQTSTRRGLLWQAFDSYCDMQNFEANQIRGWRSTDMADTLTIQCNENRRYIMAQISDWRTTRVATSQPTPTPTNAANCNVGVTEWCSDLVDDLQTRANQLQSA